MSHHIETSLLLIALLAGPWAFVHVAGQCRTPELASICHNFAVCPLPKLKFCRSSSGLRRVLAHRLHSLVLDLSVDAVAMPYGRNVVAVPEEVSRCRT